MKTRIDLRGFTIVFGDDKLSVEGPDENACTNIGQSFMTLLKARGGPELLQQYVEARDNLIEVLDIPTVTVNHPALENLTDWLKDNPEFVPSVEEALGPHGYQQLG